MRIVLAKFTMAALTLSAYGHAFSAGKYETLKGDCMGGGSAFPGGFAIERNGNPLMLALPDDYDGGLLECFNDSNLPSCEIVAKVTYYSKPDDYDFDGHIDKIKSIKKIR